MSQLCINRKGDLYQDLFSITRKLKGLWHSCQQGSTPSELNPPKLQLNLRHLIVYFSFCVIIVLSQPHGVIFHSYIESLLFTFCSHLIVAQHFWTHFDQLGKMSPALKVQCRSVENSLRYLSFHHFCSQHSTSWTHFDWLRKFSLVLKDYCRSVENLLRN